MSSNSNSGKEPKSSMKGKMGKRAKGAAASGGSPITSAKNKIAEVRDKEKSRKEIERAQGSLTECKHCNGKGVSLGGDCPSCNGKGKSELTPRAAKLQAAGNRLAEKAGKTAGKKTSQATTKAASKKVGPVAGAAVGRASGKIVQGAVTRGGKEASSEVSKHVSTYQHSRAKGVSRLESVKKQASAKNLGKSGGRVGGAAVGGKAGAAVGGKVGGAAGKVAGAMDKLPGGGMARKAVGKGATKLAGGAFPPLGVALKANKILKKFGVDIMKPKWWIYLIGAVILFIPLIVGIVLMVVPMLVLSIALDKFVEIPGLKGLAKFFGKIGCTVGSQTACQWDQIMKELDNLEDLEETIQSAVDCDNLPPDADPKWCDKHAIPEPEEGGGGAGPPNPIPPKNMWMVRVWMEAGKKYDVDWKIIAATHATKTYFGTPQQNCVSKGGQYNHYGAEIDKWSVDGGYEYNQDSQAGEEGSTCKEHLAMKYTEPEKEEKETPAKKDTAKKEEKPVERPLDTVMWNKKDKELPIYRNFVNGEEPTPVRKANPVEDPKEGFYTTDMVDATFTQARMLSKFKSGKEKVKGIKEWKYNGDAAGECNTGVPGSIYVYPGLGGSSTIEDIKIAGDKPTEAEKLQIIAAIYSYFEGEKMGGHFAVTMASIETGGTFNPNVKNAGGYMGLFQTQGGANRGGDAKYDPKGIFVKEVAAAGKASGKAAGSYPVITEKYPVAHQIEHAANWTREFGKTHPITWASDKTNVNKMYNLIVRVQGWTPGDANDRAVRPIWPERWDEVGELIKKAGASGSGAGQKNRIMDTDTMKENKKEEVDGDSKKIPKDFTAKEKEALLERGEFPYKGKKPKDIVSKALMHREGSKEKWSACYPAHAFAWYEALKAYTDYSDGLGSSLLGGGLIAWPTKTKLITSPFGPRWGRLHEGIDVGVASVPLYAVQDGTVIAAESDGCGSYGYLIIIQHNVGGKKFVSLYAHMNKASDMKVKVGDTVKIGQQIGISGNCASTGAYHLHFEIRMGEATNYGSALGLKPVDPVPLFSANPGAGGPATEAQTKKGLPSGHTMETWKDAKYSGSGRKTVAPGKSSVTGRGGRLVTFSVEVDTKIAGKVGGASGFADEVEKILLNNKSWVGSGRVKLQRVARNATLRVKLVPPGETQTACVGMNTEGITSCHYAGNVIINYYRWAEGAYAYGTDLAGYRTYVINHEFGHGLGKNHPTQDPHNYSCPEKAAPVMLQQTYSKGKCTTVGAWPNSSEKSGV